MNTIKNAFKRGILQGVGFAIAFTGSTVLLAATVAGTVNTFTTGDLLDAAKINENFTSLRTAVESINPQYTTAEVATDRKWIDGKTIYRKVVNTGTLPSGGIRTTAHGIANVDTFISTRGMARSAGGSHVPLPFVEGQGSPMVQVEVSLTQISISSNANYAGYTSSFVILEYTKN